MPAPAPAGPRLVHRPRPVRRPRCTAPDSTPGQPPQRWLRALFVPAVPAGLPGMHALAPGGGTGHGHGEHARAAHTKAAVIARGDCPEGDGLCGGHRLHHADPTCASGAVNGSPQPPALVPDPVTALAPAAGLRSCAVTAPDAARAPPSLAELRLLRIQRPRRPRAPRSSSHARLRLRHGAQRPGRRLRARHDPAPPAGSGDGAGPGGPHPDRLAEGLGRASADGRHGPLGSRRHVRDDKNQN